MRFGIEGEGEVVNNFLGWHVLGWYRGAYTEVGLGGEGFLEAENFHISSF